MASEAGSGRESRQSQWNVPYQRNIHFSGRADDLRELRAALTSEDKAKRVVAIHGLGGVGKTQVAMEYAYRHRDDYAIVWWVASDEPATMALTYAKLASRLGLRVPDGASLEDISQGVRRALDRRDDWLLIFDNVAAAEDVRRFLPQQRTGHVLITSRNPHWRDTAMSWPLKGLNREDSMALLRRRTQAGPADSEVLAKLAQALGDLPLALDQAAACIEQTHISVGDYLRRFETHWAELLTDVRPSGEYPDTVAMTWELSFRQVQEASPDAADLLNLCSFLAPDNVQRQMLARGRDALPELLRPVVQDPMTMDRAIRALSVYSLIDVGERSFGIHRLVGALVRERMSDDERRTWASAAVRMLAMLFKFDSQDLATWESCSELLPHALAVATHAEAFNVETKAAVALLEDAGRYLHKRAQYPESKYALERAMALATAFYGENHPRVATVANNLGRVLIELGDLAEARACFELCLSIDKPRYGEADPHVAAVLNNYGVSLHHAGERESARQQFEFALSVYEMHYGAEHAKVANVVNNLGYLAHSSGDQETAKAHFGRALAIAEGTYGPDHPVVANILTNLGIVMRVERRLADARQHFERALSIMERAHGPNHPAVSRALVQLGFVYLESGLLEAARQNFERAVKVDETVHGSRAPIVAERLKLLGHVLKDMNDVDGSSHCIALEATILGQQPKTQPQPRAATAPADISPWQVEQPA